MGKMKTAPKPKFRIGQLVETKSGLVGKVIGSGFYPYLRGGSWEHRVKVKGKKRTMYRWEGDLKTLSKKKKRQRWKK